VAEIKFYMDEHVPAAVTAGLRKRGVDVLTAQEAGMVEATDEDHFVLATNQGRVIFTQDADFLRLHAAGIEHAGIA
jgi:predicted nuclease of predicted toxin-antitoxin system